MELHPFHASPAFGPGVELMLGSARTRAAQPWADLPAALRGRLALLHHSTQAVAHPDFPKVLALHGAGKSADGNGSEMLPSLLAQELAPLLGTVQAEPVDVGGTALTVLTVVQVAALTTMAVVVKVARVAARIAAKRISGNSTTPSCRLRQPSSNSA